jgi:Holliday junction resolvase RusA-like endonuclease
MYRVEIEVEGQPQGKARPRMSRFGHVYTPQKTRDYEKRIKAAAWAAMQRERLEATNRPVHIDMVAFMDIPKSWSNTKKIAAEFDAFRHTTKPDLDNILKAALDGISGPQGVVLDDKQVHSVKAKKVFCHPDRGPVLYISISWE